MGTVAMIPGAANVPSGGKRGQPPSLVVLTLPLALAKGCGKQGGQNYPHGEVGDHPSGITTSSNLMNSSLRSLAPALLLLSLPGPVQAAISFSGRTWETLANEHRDHPGVFNEYTAVDANTGTIRGIYNSGDLGDSVMTTTLSLGVGDTVSYDFFLSNNGNNIPPHNGGNYFGDATFVFQTTATFGNSNRSTDRIVSGNNHNQVGTNGTNIDLTNLLATGVHAVWTFNANSYSVTLTSLADSSVTMTDSRAYEPGTTSPADIHGFRAGLWDSEQTLTIQDFTVTPVPEPASLAFGTLGSLTLVMSRRRRR